MRDRQTEREREKKKQTKREADIERKRQTWSYLICLQQKSWPSSLCQHCPHHLLPPASSVLSFLPNGKRQLTPSINNNDPLHQTIQQLCKLLINGNHLFTSEVHNLFGERVIAYYL